MSLGISPRPFAKDHWVAQIRCLTKPNKLRTNTNQNWHGRKSEDQVSLALGKQRIMPLFDVNFFHKSNCPCIEMCEGTPSCMKVIFSLIVIIEVLEWQLFEICIYFSRFFTRNLEKQKSSNPYLPVCTQIAQFLFLLIYILRMYFRLILSTRIWDQLI